MDQRWQFDGPDALSASVRFHNSERPLQSGPFGRFGSLCRALHNDPYAELAIMRRKGTDPVLLSHEVGPKSAYL